MSNSSSNVIKFSQENLKALLVIGSLLLVLIGVSAASASEPGYITGLVFIDENEDGVWNAGEPGYGGEYTVREDDDENWIWAYYGTEITFTPAGGDPVEDGYMLETAGITEPDEDGNDLCSAQSYEDSLDNDVPVRPCEGTFGFIVFSFDPDGNAYWDIALTVPEGYRATTPTTINGLGVSSASGSSIDFGIVPID